MEEISVAIVSGPVGKSPRDITYSFIFDEAQRLAKKGLDIHVIRSLEEEASFSHSIHFHGLENTYRIKHIPSLLKHPNAIPCLGYLIPPWTLLSLSKYAGAVTKATDSQNVDLIHAHFAYPEGFVGLLAKRETRKPLIVTVHGYDILVESSVKYGARLSKRINAIVKRVLNGADAVIAASRATFNEVCKIVNKTDNVHLIPGGVDIERFNPNLNSSYMKTELGIEGCTVIFTLRAHEPKYGLEYLIRAASKVTREKDDAVFVIGGDGSLRCYHEQLAARLGIKEKTIFTGRIPQREVPYYYAMSNIVVVPSLQEAFGLVVSEAMACGKPVIGTNVGGIPDQIIDGYNGFLVRQRSPAEIAEKILWLISNPNEARSIGMNGRKIVEKMFNVEDRINRILTLYKHTVPS